MLSFSTIVCFFQIYASREQFKEGELVLNSRELFVAEFEHLNRIQKQLIGEAADLRRLADVYLIRLMEADIVPRSLPIASGRQLLLLLCAVVAQARIVADASDDPGDPFPFLSSEIALTWCSDEVVFREDEACRGMVQATRDIELPEWVELHDLSARVLVSSSAEFKSAP